MTTQFDTSSRRRRRRRPPQTRRIDLLNECLVYSVLLVGLLWLGGTERMAAWSTALLMLLSGITGYLRLRSVPVLTWVALGVAGYTCLQAMPVPSNLLQQLSPAAADIWARCLLPLGEPGPKMVSVSLDPGATWLEAAKWGGYGLFYMGCAALTERHGPARLVNALYALAVTASVITLAHGALGLDKVYGVYKPTFDTGRWGLGPLLNSNNLAGYICLGGFCGASAARYAENPQHRTLLLVALPVLIATLLLTGSRGGISAASAGALVLIATRLRRGLAARTIIPAILGVTALTAFIVFAAQGRQMAEVLESSSVEQKLAGWRWSLPLIGDYWALGVGRGAFESVFLSYRGFIPGADWTSVYSHPENFPIQWACEWGLLGTLALFLLAGLAGWRFVHRERPLDRGIGVAIGISVLLLQNLVDLGLELPGLACALVAALATIRPHAERPRVVQPWFAALIFAAHAGVLVAAFSFGFRSLHATRAELHERYERGENATPEELAQVRRDLRTAMLTFPAESYFSLVGALTALRSDFGPLGPWIQRALEREPFNGKVHFALAHALQASNRLSQALLHLRLAGDYDSTIQAKAARLAVTWGKSFDAVVPVVAPPGSGDALLPQLCPHFTAESDRLKCLREASRRDSGDLHARELLAEALLRAIADNAPSCSGQPDACLAEVRQQVAALDKQGADSGRFRLAQGRLLAAEGKTEQAVLVLFDKCPRNPSGVECLKLATTLALNSKSPKLFDVADQLKTTACTQPKHCVAACSWLARQFAGRKDWRSALRYLQEAAAEDSTFERWVQVAQAAENAGAWNQARAALRRAERMATNKRQQEAVHSGQARLARRMIGFSATDAAMPQD